MTDIPMITVAELEKAEPGLYVVQGDTPNVPRTETRDRLYDVEHDVFVDGPHVLHLMARVRKSDGRTLPGAVHKAWTRPDGCEVIMDFSLPPATV